MTGRTALITGGSRGIGLAVATALARDGWSLMITARRPDGLAEAARVLTDAGAAHVVTVPGDLADRSAATTIVDSFRRSFVSMDALVLNAGVGTAGAIADYPMDRFDKTVDVNFRAPFDILQQSLPLLRSAADAAPATGARVVALASLTGVYPEAGLAAYGATKAAILSLIDTLNSEESVSGVSGTAIAPGYVDTDMSAWVTDRIPAESMIAVNDVVEIVQGILRMSARSVVSRIVVTRAGAGTAA